jgi:RTX toxin transport system membrane fusion protein
VEKGEPLIAFNSIQVQTELEELSQQLIYKQLQESKLEVLISIMSKESLNLDKELAIKAPVAANLDQVFLANQELKSDWDEVRTKLNSFNTELAVNYASQLASKEEKQALQALLKNITDRLDASYKLYKKRLIARVAYLEQKKEQLQTQLALTEKSNQLLVLQEQAVSVKAKRDSYLTQSLREYYDQLSTTELEIATLSQRLLQAKNKNRQHTLHAPVKGVVQQMVVHTVGGVVQPAQVLMVIVPEEAALEVEAMVLNKDVGFIASGQAVEIKVDAFPYTRYGTLSGEVVHISKDAVKDEKLGLVFPTLIRLKSSEFQVGNMPFGLQAGMSVKAEVRTGRRRVIDYLLSPLKQYQSEALRER